jgi:hypothetical protein
MSEYTKDEALAFVEAMRLTLTGKVGFKWLVEKMSDLAGYIESVSAENERLNAYVDSVGARDGYESHRVMHPGAAPEDDAAQAPVAGGRPTTERSESR